jgi:hypothetical protein
MLPAGPYRDASDYAEERVRHLDHSDRIPARPPVLVGCAALVRRFLPR